MQYAVGSTLWAVAARTTPMRAGSVACISIVGSHCLRVHGRLANKWCVRCEVTCAPIACAHIL